MRGRPHGNSPRPARCGRTPAEIAANRSPGRPNKQCRAHRYAPAPRPVPSCAAQRRRRAAPAAASEKVLRGRSRRGPPRDLRHSYGTKPRYKCQKREREPRCGCGGQLMHGPKQAEDGTRLQGDWSSDVCSSDQKKKTTRGDTETRAATAASSKKKKAAPDEK